MILIRVDDFPQTKGEPQHTLAAFREFNRELVALTGVRYLLGVIPGRCTVDDVLFLRNETDCVIGLHGIHHDEAKLDVYQNEFPPYLSKLEIRNQLAEAKAGLESAVGRTINVYMPPRNRIDQRTASVLNGLFSVYTAGPETDREVMQRFARVAYSDYPHEYGRTDELFSRDSHLALMQKSDAGHASILALHWTWESNIGLSHMRKFLSAIPRRYFMDFDA